MADSRAVKQPRQDDFDRVTFTQPPRHTSTESQRPIDLLIPNRLAEEKAAQTAKVEPPLKPKYMEILKRRIRAKNAGKPETDTSTQCYPHGMPRLMESPYPIEIVQTPGRVTILHEVAHEVRRFYLNQQHPKNLKISFLGHSVAHWEGNTLVVDTTSIDARSFIDDEGSSHSDKEHIIERFHKIDGGRQLEVDTTVEDPVTLEHPYSYKRYFQWRPDVRPAEYVCEENNRNAPVNGVTVAQ